MPYRQAGGRPDAAVKIVPVLRSAFYPTRGVRRPLLPRERSPEAPFVHLALDGAPVTDDDVARDFDHVEAAFDLAIANLDVEGVSHRTVGEAHLYEGEHAAELLLSEAFRRRLHADVGSNALLVAIPERGRLFAVDARRDARGALEGARREVKSTLIEPITGWLLRVERGKLKGRASSGAGVALPASGPTPEVRSPVRSSGARVRGTASLSSGAPAEPSWMPRSATGKAALLLACFALVMLIGVSRGLMQRRARRSITVPDPAALESLSVARERYEGDIARVVVSASDDGTVLSLRQPDLAGANAVLAVAERMRREARARPGLRAMHGYVRSVPGTAADITDPSAFARQLEDALREETGAAELEVTLTVEP